MQDKTDDHGAKKKRPYVKPEVRRVILRPEEAVLAGCKTATIAGPGHGKCSVPGPCSALQS